MNNNEQWAEYEAEESDDEEFNRLENLLSARDLDKLMHYEDGDDEHGW